MTDILKIAREVKDRWEEGRAYCDLGNVHHSLGDFKNAIHYYEILILAGNLGCACHRLGDVKTAIDYHEHCLKVAQEEGDKSAEGRTYCSLGNVYHSLGNLEKARDYHDCDLEIAKEVGEMSPEGRAYGNLGNDYHVLGDFKKAIDLVLNVILKSSRN